MSEYGHDEFVRDSALIEQTWGSRDSDGTTAVDRILSYVERLEAENENLDMRYTAAVTDMNLYRETRDHWKAVAEWLASVAVTSDLALSKKWTRAELLAAAQEAVKKCQ